MMDIPGFFDYAIPSNFLLGRSAANTAFNVGNEDYQDYFSGSLAEQRALGLPNYFPQGVEASRFDFQGSPEFGVPAADLVFMTSPIQEPSPGSGVMAYYRTELPNNYFAPAGFYSGTYIDPFGFRQDFLSEDPNFNTFADNFREAAYLASTGLEARQGYDAVQSAIDNVSNWNDVAELAQNAFTDQTRSDAANEARVALARRGLLGSSLAEQLLRRQPRDVEVIADLVGQALDYYRGLRNADLTDFTSNLSGEVSRAYSQQTATQNAGAYGSQAADREADNFQLAQDFVGTLDVASPFDGFLQRIRSAPQPNPTISAGGGGLTAYTGELANPSGIQQRLPRDQEFAGTFLTGGGRPNKGKVT